MASAQVLSWPTPFCRRDTNKKDARSNPHLYLPWNYKPEEAEALAA
jgi:hypothetical protein